MGGSSPAVRCLISFLILTLTICGLSACSDDESCGPTCPEEPVFLTWLRVSPEAHLIGTPPYSVTLSAAFGFPAEVRVTWDGEFVPAEQLEMDEQGRLVLQLDPAWIDTVGYHQIKVDNSDASVPVDGATNTVGFTVYRALRGLNAEATLFNPTQQTMFVASESDSTLHHIVPWTGETLEILQLDCRAEAMAISDDGQYLYVAPPVGPVVRRVDLTSGAIDLHIVPPGFGDHVTARDIEVLPGQPQSIAVAYTANGLDGYAVLVFDGDVARNLQVSSSEDPPLHITVGRTGNWIYGLRDGSYAQAVRLSLEASGVQLQAEGEGFYHGRDLFEVGGLLLTTYSGQLIDPQTLHKIGEASGSHGCVVDPWAGLAIEVDAWGTNPKRLTTYTFDLTGAPHLEGALELSYPFDFNWYGGTGLGGRALAFRTPQTGDVLVVPYPRMITR